MDACIDHGQSGYGRGGYGSASYKGKSIGAHVKALILATGEQPNGRVAMHSCDNPRCINPEHLSWGSHADNALDAVGKGRQVPPPPPCLSGELHPMSKLTREAVATIRRLYDAGAKRSDLSKQFSVSKSQLQRIVTGNGWKEIL